MYKKNLFLKKILFRIFKIEETSALMKNKEVEVILSRKK